MTRKWGKQELTADRLKWLLRYSPKTGKFIWRQSLRGDRVGRVAGSKNVTGYWQIKVAGRYYPRSRLVFLYMTGEWPPQQVDHIDGDRSNDRWQNLRLATASQNAANARRVRSKLGVRGVQPSGDKFRAYIDGQYLGTFPTIEEAREAQQAAAAKLYGQFAYHNRPREM